MTKNPRSPTCLIMALAMAQVPMQATDLRCKKVRRFPTHGYPSGVLAISVLCTSLSRSSVGSEVIRLFYILDKVWPGSTIWRSELVFPRILFPTRKFFFLCSTFTELTVCAEKGGQGASMMPKSTHEPTEHIALSSCNSKYD